jgi:exodeoxyribonuclease VIII
MNQNPNEEVHVMLDLETVSTKPNAGIIEIAAIVLHTFKGANFHRYIKTDSRFDISDDSMNWWKRQPPELREKAFNGIAPTEEVLLEFQDFLLSLGGKIILWGNGADFDNVILASAYRTCGISVPWNFYNNRCFRTLKSLYPHIRHSFTGTKHNALHDAINQAVHAERILAQVYSNG